MKVIQIHIVFVLAFLLNMDIYGQDIHFTQYDFLPNLNNPSVSGFNAEQQYGIIYRDQGFKVTNNSYQSIGLFGDFQTALLPRKYDNIGIGFVILNDKAGAGQIQTTEFLVNPSYHFRIGSELNHTISVAPQVAYIQRNLEDIDAFTFEEELLGGQFSENYIGGNSSYLDMNFGISYNGKLSPTQNLFVGLSTYHFNNNNDVFSNLNIDKFNFRTNFHSRYTLDINPQFKLSPSFQFQKSREFQELIFQNEFSFRLNENNDQWYSIGIGYRTKDAIQIILTADIGPFQIGVGYDRNTSSLSQVSTPVAGLELGLKYRRKIKRQIDLVYVPSIPRISKLFPSKFEEIELSIPLVTIEKTNPENEDTSEDNIPPIESVYPPIEFAELDLDDIYYDFDESLIIKISEVELQKLIHYMDTYPTVQIELSSHTDMRGDDDYNLTLSNRRARAAADWLISKGVDSNRIIPIGYGETQLVNRCSNGVNCSEAEHRKNRRTSFKVKR